MRSTYNISRMPYLKGMYMSFLYELVDAQSGSEWLSLERKEVEEYDRRLVSSFKHDLSFSP